ncbi:TonB-dependent receptor [Candidatus Sodalis endolongispinus]|uniref:TonB-dependent receptor n=1 Tax=Candidatus Sodalis endolongispinus TaxID=2812662 RepID=A0ABS5YDB1_9GAMM|nr:TonB-dependent receptor PqqU [Candidatus Sodalis endolongispinus]MBT9432933.1 TonB-dependent receptor [Candidatus Sodalis endolongispinus]
MTTQVINASPRFWFSSTLVCFSLSLPGRSAAEPTPPEKTHDAPTQTLIVSAPRSGLAELNTPAALSVLTGEDFRQAKPQVNLSESMGSVPGLQIQNRQNYAQDLQLSVRGFGARSMYGVRGVRIYVDGIPATMPDGQGQTSNIDLSSVDKVEVLRGPFSALYGNAYGGVVNVDTVTGSQPDKIEAVLYTGSYGSWRYGVKATGADGSQAGDVNYAVSTTRFTTHGYRDHSDARKNLGNAKLGVRINDVSTLTLLINAVDITANDPGGLTEDQWHDNPRQATRAEQFNTRKTLTQTQAGLRYQRQMSDNDDLSVMMYAGERDTTQYQAMPVATQANPLQAGGVIDLTRHYQGIDTRWTHRGALGDVPLTLTGGLDYETMTEQRKGYENYTLNNGVTELGTQGNLRRNEHNLMWSLDPYLQSAWSLTSRLTLNAGVRFSHVQFDSDDRYITADNGDDSGNARYHRWLPVGSLSYAVTDDWNAYLSAGRGFETPTINELSYRPDNQPGLNYALKPSTSNTIEVGSKARIGSGLATVALFQTDTENEIVVADISNGRTSYTNAGKTRRRGLELSLGQQFAEDIQLRLAWTLLNATYRTRACGSSDCSDGDAIAAGNRLPGIARNMGYASLAWSPPEGWYAGLEVRYMSDIDVDDENSQQAPAYTVAALDTGYRYVLGNWLMNLYGRVDNLFDRRYAGSVIVNEINGRYFEPAAGRNCGGGVSLAYTFQ